jgi:hypothetical protein
MSAASAGGAILRAVGMPGSFAHHLTEDWSLWVLDHGLPQLPRELQRDSAVPIARWSGPEFGAVLFVSRYHHDAEDQDVVDSDVYPYRRSDSGWDASWGAGGGSWLEPPLQRPDVPPRSVDLFHFHSSGSDGWRSCVAYGIAGTRASTVTVTSLGSRSSSSLESPIGAFVVAADASVAASVTVLDANGGLLFEREFSPDAAWH